MALRAPSRRSTRCAPAGALRNRVLKRTLMVSGQTGLWRRSAVMAPVCASRRTRRREVIVTRAICRAVQHPDRYSAIMCCAVPVDRPRTVHTKVVAAAGGRGDRRRAARPCGAAGAARAPVSPPTIGGSTSIISSPPGTARCRGLPPGRAAVRWGPRGRLTRATTAGVGGRQKARGARGAGPLPLCVFLLPPRRGHGETQGQRIILFRMWHTRGLLAPGALIACQGRCTCGTPLLTTPATRPAGLRTSPRT